MADDTFLAASAGKTNPRMQAWMTMSDDERKAREKEAASLPGWPDRRKHQGAIVEIGGLLGKTKQITAAGIADISNALGAFMVVRATSHDAAAKMFENHPHFAIFPGEAVEVMPVMPIPALIRPRRCIAKRIEGQQAIGGSR